MVADHLMEEKDILRANNGDLKADFQKAADLSEELLDLLKRLDKATTPVDEGVDGRVMTDEGLAIVDELLSFVTVANKK